MKINQISLDESGEHMGVCSEDGKVSAQCSQAQLVGQSLLGFTHASDWTLAAYFTPVCREP